MELSFFERKKILKSTSMLDLTPFRKIEHKFEENGLVTLLYPKFKDTKFNKFMLGRRSLYIKMKLDEIGSECWLLIDGKKKVSEISEELVEKLGDKIHPVHERFGKFLSQLYNNKYISFNELQKTKK